MPGTGLLVPTLWICIYLEGASRVLSHVHQPGWLQRLGSASLTYPLRWLSSSGRNLIILYLEETLWSLSLVVKHRSIWKCVAILVIVIMVRGLLLTFSEWKPEHSLYYSVLLSQDWSLLSYGFQMPCQTVKTYSE